MGVKTLSPALPSSLIQVCCIVVVYTVIRSKSQVTASLQLGKVFLSASPSSITPAFHVAIVNEYLKFNMISTKA